MCAWKHPRAPSVRKIFDDERTTEVVLTFLRDAEVGCMVSLAPPEEGEGEDEWEEEGEEEGWARPRMYPLHPSTFFLCLPFYSPLSFSGSSPPLWRNLDGGDQGALL